MTKILNFSLFGVGAGASAGAGANTGNSGDLTGKNTNTLRNGRQKYHGSLSIRLINHEVFLLQF